RSVILLPRELAAHIEYVQGIIRLGGHAQFQQAPVALTFTLQQISLRHVAPVKQLQLIPGRGYRLQRSAVRADNLLVYAPRKPNPAAIPKQAALGRDRFGHTLVVGRRSYGNAAA